MLATDQANKIALEITHNSHASENFPGMAEIGCADDAFTAEAVVHITEAIRTAKTEKRAIDDSAAFGRLEMLIRFNLTSREKIENALMRAESL